jgi:hypothetical protein
MQAKRLKNLKLGLIYLSKNGNNLNTIFFSALNVYDYLKI